MAFTRNWTTTTEGYPADSEDAGDGASRIRAFKVDVRERMNVDHYMDPAGTQADHGEHRQVSFQAPIATPTYAANKAFLYGKDVSSKIELHFLDEDGNEIQITTAGALNWTPSIPSGTKMLFYADTAPSGWTIDDTMDDKAVMVTKGSAESGETGGGAHSTGTWTQPDHTLTEAEIPAHNHTAETASDGAHSHDVRAPKDSSGNPGTGWSSIADGANQDLSGAARSAGAHTHVITVGDTGDGDPHNHGNAWRPAAYCFIVCSKD